MRTHDDALDRLVREVLIMSLAVGLDEEKLSSPTRATKGRIAQRAMAHAFFVARPGAKLERRRPWYTL
jgi:hypothetical protein